MELEISSFEVDYVFKIIGFGKDEVENKEFKEEFFGYLKEYKIDPKFDF